MARVTVEDCVDKVPNRFELVMLAAHRAREIAAGSPITIERDNDKNPVVALREIAEETQSAEVLRERMIESHQTQIEVDEPEEDQMALLMSGEIDRPMGQTRVRERRRPPLQRDHVMPLVEQQPGVGVVCRVHDPVFGRRRPRVACRDDFRPRACAQAWSCVCAVSACAASSGCAWVWSSPAAWSWVWAWA